MGHHFGRGLFSLIFCLFAAGLNAQTPENMLTGDWLSCFNRLEGGSRVSATQVDAQGPGFTRAIRINTRELSPGNPWDLRLRCFGTRPARRNDVGIATYYIRTTQGDLSVTQFVAEQNGSPFSKPAQWTSRVGRDWTQVNVVFNWDQDYPGTSDATRYNLSFWVNTQIQEIEIAGFQLQNYGQNFDVSSLNLPDWPYPGADAAAPWRATAAARIEKFRKGDIAVVIRDEQGQPVANAPVRVRMKKHAFGWGTAVDSGTINGTNADSQRYKQEIARNFNTVTPENDLKWPFVETWARGRFDQAFPWIKDNGLDTVHGHVLVWPGRRNLPPDVVALLDANPVDRNAIRRRINSHIAAILASTKGKATEWDVLNEPFDNRDVQAVLGDPEMAEWFKLARENDPNIALYLNDYDIVEGGGYLMAHINHTFNALKTIKQFGGPVTGFGFQSHFNGNITPIDRIWALFEQFAAEVSTIQVTEFDVNVADQDLQARFTRDYMTLAFSHPKMDRFTLWGFWAGRHWLPNGAMFAQDWTPKKNFQVWRDLVYRDWWTNVDGVTDANGVFRARGFLGDYDVETTVGGQSRTIPLKVESGKTNFATQGRVPAGSFAASGVVNAASFQAGSVAPGQIVTIFGSGLGPTNLQLAFYSDGVLPSSVGETRVLFDGQPAPMIYSSSGQVSAIVPYRVSGTTTIEVEHLGVKTAAVQVPVAPAAPAFFACSGRPETPVVVNVTGGNRISCDANFGPIAKGSVLTMFLTGEGAVSPAIGDGKLPIGDLPRPAGGITMKIGNIDVRPCEATFAGLVFAGVAQVNLCVPNDAPSGRAELTVTSKGVTSRPVFINLQ